MKFTLFFILILLTALPAEELKKEYFTPVNDVNLSLITKDTKNDATIASIERNRYLKRISSKELLKILHAHGYRRFKARYSFVTFIKTSSIDLLELKKQLRNYFQSSYKTIAIKNIRIIPKSHLEALPKSYALKVQKNSFLKSNGIFSIVTPQKKQIFFDYYIDASLPVYFTKKKILRGEMLSYANLKQKTVRLVRFKARPIQKLRALQAAHHINADKLLTVRDVETLDLVKRGEIVGVVLKEGAFEIDMSAKALQAGGLNDIILIQNMHGKKLRAKVVGKNLVEIEAPR